MKATLVTDEMELQIVEFYKNNAARETAKYFHIRPSRLNEILAKHNIERHAAIKTELSEEQIKTLLKDYSEKSDLAICKEYHIYKKRLYEILTQNNVQRHSVTENKSLGSQTVISEDTAKRIIEYYAEHSITAVCREFSTNSERITKILAEHGVPLHNDAEWAAIKSKNQSAGLLKYNAENTEKRKPHGRIIYIYDEEYFDSSWELALWIYATDHNEPIERSPIRLDYSVDGKKRVYFPDFRYKGKLVEIKGDHMIKDNKLCSTWRGCDSKQIAAKQNCISDNNVELWPYAKVKFALDYIAETYGKSYLEQFRRKKDKTA